MSSFAAMWSPLLFGFAMFLGSALLFLVQPMLGRTLLPHLGGNPIAWNTCLVFFQATLLAGYLYANLIHRFNGLRWQPWLQLLLMATATTLCFAGVFGDKLLLDLAPRLTELESWPILSSVCLLTVVIGLPFFALAAVSPLVQRWFAHVDHPKSSDPYFLFVASNLGGLTALVVYALLIEPFSPLYAQWMSWKLAVAALGVLLCVTALCAWQSPRSPELEPAPKPSDPNAPLVPRLIGRGPATWARRFYWLFASALPVGLMMGVTDFLTMDIAPAPILWTVPIALYLLAASQSFMRFSPLAYGPSALKISLHMLFGALLTVVGISFLVLAMSTVRPGVEEQNFALMSFGAVFAVLLLAPSSWLWALQPLTALAVVFVQANRFQPGLVSPGFVMLCLICYYLSVRLCLSALAQDRPAAPALTAYYSWMGLGGLVGGLFQLIVAPLLFSRNYLEYSFLAALASTLHTSWLPHGLSDWVLCRLLFRRSKDQPEQPAAKLWKARIGLGFDLGIACLVAIVAVALYLMRGVGEPIHAGLGGPPFVRDVARLVSDYSLFVALMACVVLWLRPLRFGLALTAIVLLSWIGRDSQTNEKTIVRQRTPFGIMSVLEADTKVRPPGGAPGVPVPPRFTERKLWHGTTHHGSCITQPSEMHRYPTTYYHRKGPVGQVMRNLEWFRVSAADLRIGKVDFWMQHNRDNAKDDARIAASLVGMSVPLGISPIPGNPMVSAWSEPPYACVGLGTGSLFCYAHPFQWVDAYELDPAIIELSTKTPPIFHYYQSADKRGVHATLVPGDARRNLAKPGRDGFYQVIFVDAFNSEAIPVHLLTREAIEIYFQKLAPEGVVCFHTSNRYVELGGVLENVAHKLDLAIKGIRARSDQHPDRLKEQSDPLYYQSEWIALARNRAVLEKWTKTDAFIWHEDPVVRQLPRFSSKLLWTDEHASVLSALRPGLHWAPLVYMLLIMILFFGVFLGMIEITFAIMARLAAKPPAAAPARK
jgi:hypothetical protein